MAQNTVDYGTKFRVIGDATEMMQLLILIYGTFYSFILVNMVY